jgi:hypothetical protein
LAKAFGIRTAAMRRLVIGRSWKTA